METFKLSGIGVRTVIPPISICAPLQTLPFQMKSLKCLSQESYHIDSKRERILDRKDTVKKNLLVF